MTWFQIMKTFDQPVVTLQDTNDKYQIPVKFFDSGLRVMDVSFVIIAKIDNFCADTQGRRTHSSNPLTTSA
jgi:hypothetical protein